MKRFFNVLIVLLLVLYPLAVYFGIQHYEPRFLGLLLLAVLLIREALSIDVLKKAQGLAPLLVGVILCFFITLFNDVFFLKLYPVLMSCVFLLVFSWTLISPPSMIERIARIKYDHFSDRGVIYTKKVTIVWCMFFIVNAIIATITIFLDFSIWTLYNGLISYLFMGILFACEWLIRQRVLKEQ